MDRYFILDEDDNIEMVLHVLANNVHRANGREFYVVTEHSGVESEYDLEMFDPYITSVYDDKRRLIYSVRKKTEKEAMQAHNVTFIKLRSGSLTGH